MFGRNPKRVIGIYKGLSNQKISKLHVSVKKIDFVLIYGILILTASPS